MKANFSLVRSRWNRCRVHYIKLILFRFKISLERRYIWITSFMIMSSFMLFYTILAGWYLFWSHRHNAYITFMFYLNSRLRSLFCGCQCFLFNFYKFTDLFLCEKWRLNSRLNHSDIGTSSCSLSTDSGRCFQFRSTPIWRYLSSFKVATRPHFLFNAGRWSSLQGKSLPRRDLVWNICI